MNFAYTRSAVVLFALAVGLATTVAAPAHAATAWPTDGGAAGSTVIVEQPDNQVAKVGLPIVPIRVEATDSDPSRILLYTATDLPTGLTLSSVIGAISGTPTEAGTSVVTVTVSDGTGPTSSTTFTWTVTAN